MDGYYSTFKMMNAAQVVIGCLLHCPISGSRDNLVIELPNNMPIGSGLHVYNLTI